MVAATTTAAARANGRREWRPRTWSSRSAAPHAPLQGAAPDCAIANPGVPPEVDANLEGPRGQAAENGFVRPRSAVTVQLLDRAGVVAIRVNDELDRAVAIVTLDERLNGD